MGSRNCPGPAFCTFPALRRPLLGPPVAFRSPRRRSRFDHRERCAARGSDTPIRAGSATRKGVAQLTPTANDAAVLVLPGLDGRALRVESFTEALRAVTVNIVEVAFPEREYLNDVELVSFILEHQLQRDRLRRTASGCVRLVVVAQSYSGGVALQFLKNRAEIEKQWKVQLAGCVLVNTYCSPNPPQYLLQPALDIIGRLPTVEPPLWAVQVALLNERPIDVPSPTAQAVASSVSRVPVEVLAQRIRSCLSREAWSLWIDRHAVPHELVVYVEADSDRLLGPIDAARTMRRFRNDIRWISVPQAPHLLLFTHGGICANAVRTLLGSEPHS